ncbi:MAG TPA: nucleotidyltransferase family protein, partial [Rhizomicrobium sp.]
MILTNEFLLAAACCIWPPSERRVATIRSAAAQPVDWQNFLQVVARQRIAGLVHEGLRSADVAPPETAKDSLATDAGKISRDALKLASEALRLQAAFDAASIPVVFVKGTTLALLAYGNIGIKHAWDIDLLVTPQDLRRGCDVLAAAGYKRMLPPASMPDERFFAWAAFARECVFLNAGGTYLELHWRLSDNRAQLAHVTAASPSRSVAVSNGRTLRTLRDEALFSHLCLHGARHGWSRLKWLADLSAWLATMP